MRKRPQGGELARDFNLQAGEQEFTGRSIVIFREGAAGENEAKTAARLQSVLKKTASIKHVATTLDATLESFEAETIESAGAVAIPRLGMAVITAGNEERVAAMSAKMAKVQAADSDIEAVIPERYDYMLNHEAGVMEPERSATADDIGFDGQTMRDASRALRFLAQLGRALAPERPLERQPEEGEPLAGGCFSDTAAGTWGLEATGVLRSRFSGRGVRVAVLDTGFAMGHPDFRGRRIFAKSFVPGVTVNDVNGHGTHCIGTACGGQTSTFGPRYGIAFNSEIVVAKVFNNAPRAQARRGDVILAMDKAVAAGCKIISLSLGTGSNGVTDLEYERAITRVRRAGTLVVAASGNENQRTGSPANSADAMSVAAVDSCLRRANFASWGSNFGKVEIAGPGVDVLSSIPGGTRRLGGTSMATPHVAGIAALWLESQPGLSPDQLESLLQRMARRLPQSASEVGTGLVQAPT